MNITGLPRVGDMCKKCNKKVFTRKDDEYIIKLLNWKVCSCGMLFKNYLECDIKICPTCQMRLKHLKR